MNVNNLWIRRVFVLMLVYFFSMEIVHLMSKRHLKVEKLVETERIHLDTSIVHSENIGSNSTHNQQLDKLTPVDSGQHLLYLRISQCGSMTMIA